MFSGDERQTLPSLNHPGFEGEEFDAQKSFFDFYNLPLPEVPLLADEFSRPLTLKLICEALKDLTRESKKKGISGIASGQKSMTFVFERFVDAASADIQNRLNLPGKFCWRFLKDADGVCALMVREEREWATKDELLQLLSPRLPNWTVTQRREVLTQMLAAGVLLEDRQWTGTAWDAVIRLPYQRFSDHLVARHLLDRHLPNPLTRRAIRAAFQNDAPLGRLFASEDPDPRRGGWREALIVEFPERLTRASPTWSGWHQARSQTTCNSSNSTQSMTSLDLGCCWMGTSTTDQVIDARSSRSSGACSVHPEHSLGCVRSSRVWITPGITRFPTLAKITTPTPAKSLVSQLRCTLT